MIAQNEDVGLSLKWAKSIKTGNFTPIGTDSRTMAYANGKLYFADRENGVGNFIHVYNASTGEFIRKVVIPANVFKGAAYPNNTILTDAAGNILLMNMTLKIQTSSFQVWRMKDENATPELVLNYKLGEYGAKDIRIDYGSIYGDINKNGYIIAAVRQGKGYPENEDRLIFKWNIKSGTVNTTPKIISINAYEPSTSKSNGYSPYIFPKNDSIFYLDGSFSYPTLYDINGRKKDGFLNTTEVAPQVKVNGVAEFKLGNNTFLVCGGNYNSSSFYLYRMGEAESFSGITKLYEFPEIGLGDIANSQFIQIPIIEKISEKSANIYIYSYLNGFAKYEITIENGKNKKVDKKEIITQKAKKGVQTGVCMDLAMAKPEEVDSIIKLMANAGVDMVRLVFRWGEIEPQKGKFNWTKHDELVRKLLANNIEIDGQIGIVPSWANGKTKENVPEGHNPGCYPPIDVHDFYDFVKIIAKRYKTQIRYWTLRNEPNLASFWRPAPNIEEYTANLKAGYEAVKSVDPEIKVIGGTIAGNGVFMGWEKDEQKYFLQKMCNSGAINYCDILSIHPYNNPKKGIDALQTKIEETINVLKKCGIVKPIWVDEIGWTKAHKQKPSVTDEEIADWLTTVFTELKDVDRILWYNFKDAKYDATDIEQNFGLVDYQLKPKPSYYALKKLDQE